MELASISSSGFSKLELSLELSSSSFSTFSLLFKYKDLAYCLSFMVSYKPVSMTKSSVLNLNFLFVFRYGDTCDLEFKDMPVTLL